MPFWLRWVAIPGKKDSILSVGTANIVQAMKRHGANRLIVETGAGLIEDKKQLPLTWRLTSSLSLMKIMFDDKRGQERAVRESGLDWVIVRPSNLTNHNQANVYRTGESIKMKLSSQISRADVAEFIVRQLSDGKWLQKAVIVSN
jgi:putative NADH-flavin reductase